MLLSSNDGTHLAPWLTVINLLDVVHAAFGGREGHFGRIYIFQANTMLSQ